MKISRTAVALLINVGLIGAAPLTTHAQQAPATKGAVAVAPGAAMAVETTKASAIVVGIDAASRVVTLKKHNGEVFDVTCGPEVRNFDQIKVGDTVNAEFTRALTLELKKGGSGTPAKSEQTAEARAPVGAKPAGAVGRQVTILANVVAVDAKKKTVTLRGPQGNVVDLAVQDPEQMKNIKKGDQVEAVYTEALAVSVEAAPKAAKKK